MLSHSPNSSKLVSLSASKMQYTAFCISRSATLYRLPFSSSTAYASLYTKPWPSNVYPVNTFSAASSGLISSWENNFAYSSRTTPENAV